MYALFEKNRMTSKFLYSAIVKADKTLLTSGVNRQMRNFFAYLRVAFNKVDEQRLGEVGSDRLCAEWYGITNSISNSDLIKKN